MAMTVRRRGKFVRVTTGCVTGDIVMMLCLLAIAWAWIGLRVLGHLSAKAVWPLPLRHSLWAVAFGLGPFTQLLRVVHWLPLRADPVTGLIDWVVPMGAVAWAIVRLRRQQARQQRAWVDQKAARSLRRDHCRQAQFNTARIDGLDIQMADIQARCGEFLYYAREAGARAGIPPYQSQPESDEGRPGLRLVRGDEAS